MNTKHDTSIATPPAMEVEAEVEEAPAIVVPNVRVIDYEAAKQEFEMW